MQVIPYSQDLGRIDHVLTGDQAGADMSRVDEVLKRLPLEYVEMEPGDALFFHANCCTVPIRTVRKIRGGR